MKNVNLTSGIWINKEYIFDNILLLNNKIIYRYLKNFWKEIMNNLEKDQIVLFIFRVRLGDEDDSTIKGNYLTIGRLFKINNSSKDFKNLYNILCGLLDIKDENYKNSQLQEIIFSYKIIATDNTKIDKKITISKDNIKQKVKTYQFRGYNLPNTMNLNLWGRKITEKNNLILISKKGSKFNYEINKYYNKNDLIYDVKLLLPNKEVMLTFKDIKNNNNNFNTFTRYIGSNEYYFVNGILELRLNPWRTSFLEQVKVKNKNIDNLFLTLDIETQVMNNIIKPILISIYDGINHNNFYLPDFINESDMMNNALSFLLNPKYNKYKIYVHNLSNFDGIFLMKYFVGLKNNNNDITIKPTLKDGKFINIDIKFGRNKISFRDSLLLLLNSLNKLAKAFNVDNKGSFDFNSVNNLNITQLNDNKLREELINYCNLDCKILYDILLKFNNLVYDLFNLNFNNYPTLPSLAFGIFRNKYLNKNEIPLINSHPFYDIKNSYTGGSIDTIINYGENLYHYDMNSEYPYVMQKYNIPTGNIKAFTGNIWNIEPNAFGIFNCNIETPDNLNIPILQIHHNKRTISPLGKFNGWFFSEELKNAIDNFGYKVTIINGYTFDQKNIFKDYVIDLYNLRLQYSKDNPINLIAKILMNSLYGRFGLNIILNNYIIINKNELDDFIDFNEINDLIDIDDNFLMSFIDKNIIKNSFLSSSTDIKSNIAIASAITAYARIELSKIKKYCIDNDIKIYYFDTDSIIINKPLPNDFLTNELGKWKLEAIIKEGVFIAPKVYGYITENGNEIIKIKGYKNKISFEQLKSLLIKDNKLELLQEKWFKSLEKGEISILNQIYTLIPTLNKRQLIYKNNKLIYTIPHK